MKSIPVITILLSILIVISGCFALAEPEESSGAVAAPTLAAVEQALEPVEEPPLEPQEQVADAATAQETEAEEVVPETEASPTAPAPESVTPYPAPETAVEPPQAEPPQAYPAAEDSGDETPVPEEAADQPSGAASVYEIDPTRSQARFSIDEVLRGAPFTVVGVSNNLGGQIALDLNDPSSAEVGTILINARDFATDNDFRNNAIANEILLTDEHEFITFEPTSVSGLPPSAEIGQTYDLRIDGSLTIAGQTRDVTFEAQVTPLSATELQGLATLEILYADYGLVIPFARAVESVEENVLLELDFIATTP